MEHQLFNYWNFMTTSYQIPGYDLPPDVSEVPSLSGSPVSIISDTFSAPTPQTYLPTIADQQTTFGPYPMSVCSSSDFSSDYESPQYSPHPVSSVEPVSTPAQNSASAEQHTYVTSGRRRAQNRAAQRAFRERKEKHARDLEAQLSILNDKYNKLEASHSELNIAYQRLRKTVEMLTNDDIDAEGEDEDGLVAHRRNGNSETLRKLLEILHGEFKASFTRVKTEEM